MRRNVSRRDFGKRLVGAAAVLALPPAWNCRAAAQSLRNDLKGLSGELSFDDAALQAAADDFGHVVHTSQDDWKRPYGPAWQNVQAAKTKFDPKNVLTPGHGMFPG